MWYFKMIQNISYLNIDIQKIVASKITYFFSRPQVAYQFLQEL